MGCIFTLRALVYVSIRSQIVFKMSLQMLNCNDVLNCITYKHGRTCLFIVPDGQNLFLTFRYLLSFVIGFVTVVLTQRP